MTLEQARSKYLQARSAQPDARTESERSVAREQLEAARRKLQMVQHVDRMKRAGAEKRKQFAHRWSEANLA